MTSSGIYFPVLYLAFCTGCFALPCSLCMVLADPQDWQDWELLKAALPVCVRSTLYVTGLQQIFVDENVNFVST